jgi:hypothetical protein
MASPSRVQNSFPVCVRRQIGVEQPDQPESCYHPAVATILARTGAQISATENSYHPAVATILAHTGAQISATENSYARQHEKGDREGNQGRVREEGSKPSSAEDGEAEIGKGRYDGDEHQSGCGHHGHQAWTISLHMS